MTDPALTAPLTIGLLWHSATSDNLGVGALTAAQVAIVERLAGEAGRPVRFKILGWRDPRAPYVQGDNVEHANFRTREIYQPGGFAASVRGCDLVLDIGAGDSFSDIYGSKRFLKYMSAKSIVLAMGRPLILSPQTIGPFSAGWARRVAFATMRRSAAIFTRDQKSIDILRDQGFDGPVELASDVALRLPYTPPEPRAPGGPVRVGLNVSGLLMSGGYTQDNMFGLKADYPALVTRLVEHFTGREGVELHLVAHVISDRMPVEDDYRACAKLAEAHGAVLAPKFDSPSAAKSYIAGLDFFAGARMHACIAAFSAGVPVVPMAYSRKFEGLFGALGYSHTVDCRSSSNEDIEAKMLAAFEDRDRLKAEAEVAFQRGLEALSGYEAFLTEKLTMQPARQAA